MSSNRSPLSAVFALAFAVLLVTSTAFSGVVLASGHGSISGNVSTQEGNADGISIELTNTEENGTTYGRTVDDVDGAFNIQNLDAGTYDIVITERIHEDYTQTINLSSGENFSLGNVTLSATGEGEIYGEISTEGSQNATDVVVKNASGDVVVSQNNAPVGNYSIVVPGDDGPYTMTVSTQDHETITRSVTVGSIDRANENFALSFVNDGKANGTVNLENPSNYSVNVNLIKDGNITRATQFASGSSYNFTADPGNYKLNVSAPFHVPEERNITLTESNTTVEDFTLDAIPESITGTVTTERNDYTGDIQVTVENASAQVVAQQNFTGSEITYDFDVNGLETYTVSADATGYNTNSSSVTISNTSEEVVQDLSLTASNRGDHKITASTSDGNASSISINLNETDTSATVTDGGSQTFDLPTGSYKATISASNYQTKTVTFSNTADDSEAISVTLQKAPGNVNVTVDAPNADPSQNFTVTVNETGDSATVQNGDNVTFGLSEGTYNVTADATNFTSDTSQFTISSNTVSDVTLNPYEPKTMDVTLNLNNTSAATSGTISVAETGNSYTVNDGDTLSITGLRQDTYTVTAEANGHVNQTSNVIVGDSGGSKTFNLADDTSTGIVAITTKSEDGNATGFTVDIAETDQSFTTNENETIQVELTAGNYTVTADADGYNASTQTVTVTQDSTQAVEFNLGVNTSVTFNETGERIADGKSLWVGQTMFREDLGNYTEVRWRNEVTGLTYDRSIDSDDFYRDSVRNITKQLGSNADYTLFGVDSGGNTTEIASVFLGVQTLDVSMTPNATVDDVNVNFNSNRQEYRVIVTQDAGDTNQLNDTRIRDLFEQDGNATIETIDGSQEVVVSVSGTSSSQTLNMSELERATYNFDYDVVDTAAASSSQVTLVVSQEQDEPDVTITDGGRFWLGQNLLVEDANVSAQETIGIYRNQNNTFVQELTADEFGEVVIRTESLGTGEYYIEDDTGQRLYEFTIARQTFDASWTDNEVLNGGSQTESGLTIESNRARYDLLISAERTNDGNTTSVEAGQIASAFDLNTTTVNGSTYAVAQDLSNPETLVADFDEFKEGNYTFTVTASDAVGSDTAEILVEVPIDGQALFKEQFFTHNRGDLARITVEFTGDTRTSLVKIGRENQVGYQLRANVTRNSNRSEVTLVFDTSKAGRNMESQTLYARNNDGSVNVISETELAGDHRLEDGRYLMELQVDNQTTDLSTLNLFKAKLFGGDTYGISPTTSSVGSESVIQNETVVMDEIDGRSYVAFGYRVQGLETQLNDTNRSAAQFNPSDQFAQDTGLSFEIVKENGGVNSESETVNAGQALAYHYIKMNNNSEENKTAMVWFVFDGSEFNNNGDGLYEANFTVSEDNYFVDEQQSITSNFTFVETETKFDRHWSGDLLMLAEQNQSFTGTTTLPPGTILRHEIRSDNVRYPFFDAKEIVVTENQTFSATYDLSNVPLGLTFNTSIPSQMGNKSVEVVPEIQPAPPSDMTNVTVWTQVNGQSYETEVEFSSQTLGDTTVSTDGTPAQGTAYMQKGTYTVTGQVNLNGTNVTVNRQVTLEANNVDLIVNHNQNGGSLEKADPREKPDRYTLTVELVGENNEPIDGIVTIGGQQMVVSNGSVQNTLTEGQVNVNARSHNYQDASQRVTLDQDKTITIQMTKRDDIETPTPTPEPSTPQQTETPGQPGFGVVLALLSMLGAFLLARRQD